MASIYIYHPGKSLEITRSVYICSRDVNLIDEVLNCLKLNTKAFNVMNGASVFTRKIRLDASLCPGTINR